MTGWNGRQETPSGEENLGDVFGTVFQKELPLLSRFSRVRLCATPDGSPPGSPSLGFSRQEHWSGLPFPSPMHESEK